jgi:hypothetical protein
MLTTLPQTCSPSKSPVLDQNGSASGCRATQTQAEAILLAKQVKNTLYQTLLKAKAMLRIERKLQDTLREFCHKYIGTEEPPHILSLEEKLKHIRRDESRKRGDREAAAIVVYFDVKDKLKTNIKVFCRSNDLNVKVFHKKYKTYHRLFCLPMLVT